MKFSLKLGTGKEVVDISQYIHVVAADLLTSFLGVK